VSRIITLLVLGFATTGLVDVLAGKPGVVAFKALVAVIALAAAALIREYKTQVKQ
jgi:hypothetical protein